MPRKRGPAKARPPTNYAGAFLSYVHKDDYDGRISCLREDVRAEYETITGDPLDLFLDTEDLEWGDQWRTKIDDNIADHACFIAVMTPRYFLSPECRRELTFFIEGANRLGLPQLLLPLYYVTTPLLENQTSDDALAKKLHLFQYEDWRDLRFAERRSEQYRRGIHKLAQRLAHANDEAERRAEGSDPEGERESDEDDEPDGTLDRLAAMEEALPKWESLMKSIADETKNLTAKLSETSAELTKHAQSSFKHKRAIARGLAKRMVNPVEKLEDLVPRLVENTYQLDAGLRVLVSQAPDAIDQEPGLRDTFLHLFGEVRAFADTIADCVSVGEAASAKTKLLETVSRDLRPVVRRWRRTTATMAEVGTVTGSWIKYLDASGIESE